MLCKYLFYIYKFTFTFINIHFCIKLSTCVGVFYTIGEMLDVYIVFSHFISDLYYYLWILFRAGLLSIFKKSKLKRENY